jgi:hypothetical protein
MIELLILITMGFVIAAGSFYLGRRHYEREMLSMIEDVIDELTINLVLERVNEQYFLYREEDGQFVGQADTISNLAEIFTRQMGADKIGLVTGIDTFSIIDGRIERAESVEEQ